MIVKDFFEIGGISGNYGTSMKTSVVVIFEPGKESKRIRGLKIEVKEGGRVERSNSAFLDFEEVESFLERMSFHQSLRVCGLMGMAPYSPDPEASRPYFRRLRELFERFNSLMTTWSVVSRKVLSMGMSGDFEVAIEEGANMVRIGTKIFGERA